MEITPQTLDDLSTITAGDPNGLISGIDWTGMLTSSILIIVISHFGAKYLASVSPRGYWFWFMILNIVVGLFFL